ncbi:hypothetical protein SDC9_142237 [bioreactor metagenome]|uniref:Uncharacterized protein n=1 Tax=bioreactor metagenome TaxID=1076179 RepID=A0A645E0I8_9ZZZZ
MQAHRLGPQQIVAGEFTPQQALRTQLGNLEMVACLLAHRQGNARGQDLVFHHIVAQQFQTASVQRQLQRLGGGLALHTAGFARLGPDLLQTLQPVALVAAVGRPRIAALLHFARRARLRSQGGGEFPQPVAQCRQPGDQSLGKALTAVHGQTLVGGR